MKLLLNELELTLKQCQLWQEIAPSEEALASEQPFAIDTLAPHEWLQWVFIDRMTALLNAGQGVPKGFEIAPYFEECWKHSPQYTPILLTLRKIDEVARG
jgi:uncharacterized protein YqcC (DUF446 family)